MLERCRIPHFLTPVKIRGGVDDCWRFTYDRTSGTHLMASTVWMLSAM